MSAPSIPNLLSLRGSRGGARGRGRGRGRGGHSSSSSPSSATISQDTVIQGTDTDAAVSRMSAVDMGYLDDPFAQFFVQQPHQQPHQHGPGGGVPRRLPIINRGMYVSVRCLFPRTDSWRRCCILPAFLSPLCLLQANPRRVAEVEKNVGGLKQGRTRGRRRSTG